MKLTQAEKKWFKRLQKTLDAAPESLRKKAHNNRIVSYTIGDPFIIVYDGEKVDKWVKDQDFMTGYYPDVNQMVDRANAELYHLTFPFAVESTAG